MGVKISLSLTTDKGPRTLSVFAQLYFIIDVLAVIDLLLNYGQ